MLMALTRFDEPHEPPTVWGWAAFAWASLGFVVLIGDALYRLAPLAWQAMTSGAMAWWHWGLLGGWVVFMAYTEGYRGFHRRFSPRFAARAKHLASSPTLLRALLAPLFCMGLFHATRRVLITSWVVLAGVVLLIIAVRQLDQPWRGIVDAGVVVGLLWGALSTLVFLFRAGLRNTLPSDPQIPG